MREPSSEGNVSWGSVNRPVTAEKFEAVRSAMFTALGDTELFVQDCLQERILIIGSLFGLLPSVLGTVCSLGLCFYLVRQRCQTAVRRQTSR